MRHHTLQVNEETHRPAPLWFLLVVIAAAVGVYASTLKNPLLFDDEVIILKNPGIRTWQSFRHLFDRGYFQCFQELSYRPVVSLTYLVDHGLWGLKPFGYHLTNLLLHAALGAMVFLYLRSIVPGGLVAPAASLAYVVHPVLTEVVNVAGFREDSLCALFMFLSLLLYNRASRAAVSPAAYALALVSFLIALFAKETALILPALLVLQDLALRRGAGVWKKRVGLYAGFVAAAVLYGIVRFGVVKNPDELLVPYAAGSFGNTLLTMPWVVMRYLRILLFPMHLNIRYDFLSIASAADVRFVLSAIAILALLAIAVWRFRRSPLVAFAILWFFITLGPVSNLVPIGNLMTERFLTLPLLGFCLLLGGAMETAAVRRGLMPGAVVAMALVLVCYGAFTVARNVVWGDERLLVQQSVIGDPESGRAWDAVAQRAIEQRDWPRGRRLCERAQLLLEPLHQQDSRPVYDLGVCLRNLGELGDAKAQFDRILKGDPMYYMALLNLAEICRLRGDTACSWQKAAEATKVQPDNPEAWGYLAGLARIMGDRARECEALRRYVALTVRDDPRLAEALKRMDELCR